MTSRLDRLFVLLETGSTPAIRKAAANQLGEVRIYSLMSPAKFYHLLSAGPEESSPGASVTAEEDSEVFVPQQLGDEARRCPGGRGRAQECSGLETDSLQL